VPGILPGDMGTVYAEVEQLQVTMLDGEEMDVKAVLCFSTMVFEHIPMELISRIEVTEPDSALMSSLPGMVIYVVKEGDNLWNIGRKYYVPVAKLRELNNLSSDELQTGQKLLIVKGN
jgi:nucleoid-associated protein YgaU